MVNQSSLIISRFSIIMTLIIVSTKSLEDAFGKIFIITTILFIGWLPIWRHMNMITTSWTQVLSSLQILFFSRFSSGFSINLARVAWISRNASWASCWKSMNLSLVGASLYWASLLGMLPSSQEILRLWYQLRWRKIEKRIICLSLEYVNAEGIRTKKQISPFFFFLFFFKY